MRPARATPRSRYRSLQVSLRVPNTDHSSIVEFLFVLDSILLPFSAVPRFEYMAPMRVN
jgi:hypothetical protein